KLLMGRAAKGLNRIFRCELFADAELRHVAHAGGLHVPVTSNLGGILFVEDWIKDRLLRKTRRKCSIAAGADQFKFLRPNRAKERNRVVHIHDLRSLGWGERAWRPALPLRHSFMNSFQSSISAVFRMSAETGNSFGARGALSSLRPASCGRRSALRWFTSLADQTRFSQASLPPR